MKKELLNQVLDIVKLNEAVENLYNKLAELEINHKAYQEEYDNNVSLIQMALDIINKKLKNISFTDEDLIDIEDSLGELNGFNDEDHDIVIDLLELTTNNKIRKTCMQLYYLTRENNCGYVIENIENNEYVDNDLDAEAKKELDDLADELLIESIEKEDEIELLKDKLLAHTLMEYLLDAIKQEQNEEIKSELIRVKYRLIYLLKDLEKCFINSPKNFSKLHIYQEILKYREIEDVDLYEEIYTEPIKDIILYELNYLSQLDDKYYQNTKNRVRAILRVIYIKTFLSINYDQKIEAELKNKLEEIQPGIKCPISKENILKSFEIKKELSVPKKVDLY